MGNDRVHPSHVEVSGGEAGLGTGTLQAVTGQADVSYVGGMAC